MKAKKEIFGSFPVFMSLASMLVFGPCMASHDSKLSEDESAGVVKRSAIDMCRIMSAYTGRNCFDYNDYGCFCGLTRTKGRPVDGVDRCCQAHDRCYGAIRCSVLPVPLMPYGFRCSGRSCTCTNPSGTCPRRACDCDITFASCLARNAYNARYKNHDLKKC
ncbi:unnamed protein product [Lymnaea stagnalis]|uniref:Phospholipase A2 n=1 Tax=Lymnaea stagnalis TaxID=6523 RepID=A0AAV2I3T6_LYMST